MLGYGPLQFLKHRWKLSVLDSLYPRKVKPMIPINVGIIKWISIAIYGQTQEPKPDGLPDDEAESTQDLTS